MVEPEFTTTFAQVTGREAAEWMAVRPDGLVARAAAHDDRAPGL